MKIVNQANVIKFIKEDIIHRFGIPESITADRGTVFTGEAVETFAKEYGIKLTHSTPYFAQISKRSSIGTTPFTLTYEHDVVLPMEVTVRSLRIAQQHNLTPAEYSQAMMQEIEELDKVRLAALDHLQVQKKAVARANNKRVRFRDFSERDLVWNAILPIGSKDSKYGKWSPT
ncbi:uncharacterized protein LOC132800707 [Ziziphus jujuba]|uniref:Uncharacterized protein LOC132800707 n=1 Tax=Ziziphus jujuba TaxID=326968 RepID=A0ABM4A2I1_ZIZJJ|nr:uncharacterized protein LOC132800707 [Ziziphus jujuba]